MLSKQIFAAKIRQIRVYSSNSHNEGVSCSHAIITSHQLIAASSKHDTTNWQGIEKFVKPFTV